MNLDPEKLFIIFVIALLVLGPNRLPQAARSLGKGLAELRKYTSTFRAEVDQVLAEPRAIIQSTLKENDLVDIKGQINQAFRPDTATAKPPAPVAPGAAPLLPGTVGGTTASPTPVVGPEPGPEGPPEATGEGASAGQGSTAVPPAPGRGGALRGRSGGANGDRLPSAVPDDPGLN